MTEKDFLPKEYSQSPKEGNVTWQSPSNIALVKYWGKKENQIPANPSISFTLDHCKTTTTLKFNKRTSALNKNEEFDFEFYFEGKKKEDFKPKIATFFKRIEQYCPFLRAISFRN